MAGPNEPQKETVRADLPLPISAKLPDTSVKPRETVRIQLPVRDARDVGPTELFEPPNQSAVAPVPHTPDPVPFEPRKETARISPALAKGPAPVQMKNTEAFVPTPNLGSRNAPAAVVPAEKKAMLLWWILLAVSALILIIQIWTYFS
jgi:hypothetical protein